MRFDGAHDLAGQAVERGIVKNRPCGFRFPWDHDPRWRRSNWLLGSVAIRARDGDCGAAGTVSQLCSNLKGV
jgi:hypothetical protein